MQKLLNDDASPTIASRAAGTTFLLPVDGAEQTATDDGVADQLTGGGNRDWIVARRNGERTRRVTQA